MPLSTHFGLDQEEIPPRPTPLSPLYDSIPAMLKAARLWSVWAYQYVNTRWTKIPFSARLSIQAVEDASRYTSRVPWWPRAKSNDTSTWASWEDARALAHYFDGIGIMVCKGICGVDLDKCVEPDGSLDAWAAKIVSDLDSYTELSPSGKGLRILTLASKPGERCRSGLIEIYTNTRFLTLTGHVIHRRPVQGRDPQIATLYNSLFENPSSLDPVERVSACVRGNGRKRQDGPRHSHVRGPEERFRALWAGDMSDYDDDHSRADLALCRFLAKPCDFDPAQIDALFRASVLMRPKWDRADYRSSTLEKAVAGGFRLTAEQEDLLQQLYGSDS